MPARNHRKKNLQKRSVNRRKKYDDITNSIDNPVDGARLECFECGRRAHFRHWRNVNSWPASYCSGVGRPRVVAHRRLPGSRPGLGSRTTGRKSGFGMFAGVLSLERVSLRALAARAFLFPHCGARHPLSGCGASVRTTRRCSKLVHRTPTQPWYPPGRFSFSPQKRTPSVIGRRSVVIPLCEPCIWRNSP